MIERCFLNSELLKLLNENFKRLKIPTFNFKYIGRDNLFRYCNENSLTIQSFSYPFKAISIPPNLEAQEVENIHNKKVIEAFLSFLTENHSSKIIYYCEEDKWDETSKWTYSKTLEPQNWEQFYKKEDIYLNFIEDILIFSEDFRFCLCLFHHEIIEIFDFQNKLKINLNEYLK